MSNSEYLLMKKTRCLSSTRNGPCIEQPKIVKSFKLRAIFGHFELQPQPNTTVFPSPQPPNVVSFLVPVYFPCACARLSLLLLSGLVLLPKTSHVFFAPCTLNATMTCLLTFPIQVSPTGSSSARRHITVVPPPHPCPAPPVHQHTFTEDNKPRRIPRRPLPAFLAVGQARNSLSTRPFRHSHSGGYRYS